MNYIIDAFNVGYKIPEVARFIRSGRIHDAMEALIHTLIGYFDNRRDRIILVVDGRPKGRQVPAHRAGMELRYSKKPQTADDLIRQFIRREKHINTWTVVSADREILNTARDHGARVLKPSDLFKRKNNKRSVSYHGSGEKPSADSVDVDYWKQLFEKGNDEST